MISIFFSSTFRDMQQERDIIQKYVFPEVELYAKNMDELISFVDLRWGIDTSDLAEQEAMKKIMTVCEEKIRDSFPCFIALLGENYGSEVDKNDYYCDGLTSGNTIGITEYEIATRLGMGKEYVTFFMRNDISMVHPRATLLRQKINQYYSNSVQEYSLSNNDEVNVFIKKMINVICLFIDYKVSTSPNKQRYLNYIKTYNESLIKRPNYSIKIEETIKMNPKCIILTGPEGIGKKSIIYNYVSDNNRFKVIGMRSKESLFRMNIESLFEQLFCQLSVILGNKLTIEKTEISATLKLSRALEVYEETYKDELFIVIEDIDKLMGDKWIKVLLNFPITDGNNIHLIFSARSIKQIRNDNVVNTLSALNIAEIPVDFLNNMEKREIIKKLCFRYDKELSRNSIEVLCNKQLSGYPLYLMLILRSMLLLDQKDFLELKKNISSDINSPGNIIEESLKCYLSIIPDDLSQLYEFLYKFYSSKINNELLDQILTLLIKTTYGLRENDLKNILVERCGWSELDFYYVIHFVSPLISIDYYDRLSLSTLTAYQDSRISNIDNKLIEYLETLSLSDVVRENELPYLYAANDRMKDCIKELISGSIWSYEKHSVFYKILQDYGDSFVYTISKMDFDNKIQLDMLNRVSFAISSYRYPKDISKFLTLFTECISEKCVNTESNDYNVAYKYSLMSCTSLIEKNMNHFEQANEMEKNAKIFFSMMQQVKLPHSVDEMSGIFEIVKLHLQIMEDLKKARKSFDNNLPEELCKYILSSIEEKFNEIFSISLKQLFGDNIILLFGIKNSYAIYYELLGDLMIHKNDIEKAMKFYIICEAIESCDLEIYSKNHAVFLLKIGKMKEKQGELDEAIRYYLTAYEEYLQLEDILDSEMITSEISLTICHIANVYVLKKNYSLAYCSL